MSKSDIKRPGKFGKIKKKRNTDILSGADDTIDEYHQSTWKSSRSPPNSPPKSIPINAKTRSFEYPPKTNNNNDTYLLSNGNGKNNKNKIIASSLPDKPDLSTKHKSQEMIYNQLNGSNKNKNKSKNTKIERKHIKSKSALPTKKKAKSKWSWKSRTSDPSTKDVEELKNRINTDKNDGNNTNKKNLIIKINHINKICKNDKKQTSKKRKNGNVIFDINAQQQILGDILIHVSSWNQLIAKHDANQLKQNRDKKILGVGWKTVYCILDQRTIKFWDVDNKGNKINNINNNYDDEKKDNYNSSDTSYTIYLSEIITLSKSIRSIDGEKYIIELNVCGLKCLLSFNNVEQREYWHSLLSDYHLNYFVWRSTPLDEKKRTSQNVINGVHKLLNSNNNNKYDSTPTKENTLNILYIEEILQKISSLNIAKIIDMVPTECKFMSGRLIRVIMSIKFFFMSVLKSLSGADIPLPSRDILINYLNEIQCIKWNQTTKEILDFYCDQCYRILFNLSFAFTSNARDEIMKLNEYIDYKKNNKNNNKNNNNKNNKNNKSTKTKTKTGKKGGGDMNNNNDLDQKKIAEMKYEYESLQRSWKMHRDRLQEYVMAYRDAVAKLKHSYHQRDNLCKKIETLQSDKKELKESMQLQNKNYNQTMEEAQKLTQKFSVLSQQMQPPQIMQQQMMTNYNQYPMNGQYIQPQYQQYQQQQQQQQQQYGQQQYTNNYQPGSTAISPPNDDQNQSNNNQKLQQYSAYLQNLMQQKQEIMQTDPTNPALQVVMQQIAECQQKMTTLQPNMNVNNNNNDSNNNNNGTASQIQQISQEMTNLFNTYNQPQPPGFNQNNQQNTNNKYTWI